MKTTPSTVVSSSDPDSLPNPSRFDKKSPLEYIFISVKTATKFHLNRLQVIIDTWFNLAPDQVRQTFFHYGGRFWLDLNKFGRFE